MRYVRIFLLHFEYALEHRSRSFVWFLISLFNPLLLLTFWKGSLTGQNNLFQGWNLASISSYYLLLVIAGSMLQAHVEEDIAYTDIKEGGLTKFLVKPFSYWLIKLFNEIPWRLIQGFFGIIVFVGFSFAFRNLTSFNDAPLPIILSIFIMIFAFLLSFMFKMIIGLSALWLTDFSGLMNLVEILMIIFAGFIMPIALYPAAMQTVSLATPFPYMIYFPIVAFQGKLSLLEMTRTVSIQILWVCALVIIYKLMWRAGIKKYTGVGQ